jgi:hypothetical protein
MRGLTHHGDACTIGSSGLAKESEIHRCVVSAISLELLHPTEEMLFLGNATFDADG